MKTIYMGLLHYTYTSCNIGDDIQTLAFINILKKCNIHKLIFPKELSIWNQTINNNSTVNVELIPVNRDLSHNTKLLDKPIWLIVNGWFMHKINSMEGRLEFLKDKKDFKPCIFKNSISWPFPNNIIPIFLSLHINNENMFNEEYLSYYKKFQPIGCRDKHTWMKLKRKGIESFFNGCLSLTFSENTNKTNNVYYVNTNQSVEEKDTYHILHLQKRYGSMPYYERLKIADDLIKKYSSAKKVITSRLHALLPCLAMNTPVEYIPTYHQYSRKDIRYTGLYKLYENKNLVKKEKDKIERGAIKIINKLIETENLDDIKKTVYSSYF